MSHNFMTIATPLKMVYPKDPFTIGVCERQRSQNAHRPPTSMTRSLWMLFNRDGTVYFELMILANLSK